MTVSALIVGLYILLLFAISWASKRLTTGKAENYVLAGRRMTTPLITVSIVGLAVGGASTIGVAEQAYKHGISAGWYTAAWGIGAIVMGMTVAKRYRRLNITTIPEMLERYYDRKSRIAGIVIQIIVQLCVMSLQYVAGGTIFGRSYAGGVHHYDGHDHECRCVHRCYHDGRHVVCQYFEFAQRFFEICRHYVSCYRSGSPCWWPGCYRTSSAVSYDIGLDGRRWRYYDFDLGCNPHHC